ncbi:hypothetical protein, partial [Kistimonas scapharcae]|uniref:hypothetical protein n=1 Tax=Kistimonas scapharcae TaxID=1036133 RepID=UPI0031E80648
MKRQQPLEEQQIKVQDMQETLTSKEEWVPEKSTTTEQALHEDQERLKSQILALETLRDLERKALLDAAKEQRQSTTTEMAKLKVEVALKSLQLTQMEQELVKLQAQVEATSPHLSTADKSPEASCLPVSEEAEISLSAEQVWASVHISTQMPDSESTTSATAPVEKSQIAIIQKPLLPMTELSLIPEAGFEDIATEDDGDIQQLTNTRDKLIELKKQLEEEMVSTQKLLCRPHGSQHEAYSIIFASLGI